MINKTLMIFIVCVFVASAVYPQKKLGQTGFQFLSVGADARATAMGDAYTTVEDVSAALFYNPAGMARLSSFVDMAFNQTNWIADINHFAFSFAINPLKGKYGVFGISVMAVDYGDIQGTMVWKNAKGYVDTEIIEPRAIAFGIGYARPLTDRFAVGGQIKQVAQQLGKNVIPDEEARRNTASALAFDFGTIYHTGFKSLSFGMSVRNFSEETKFEKEGFQLPLTFKIGVSMDAFDFFMGAQQDHEMLVVIDAAHPRSYPEYINLGGEYKFKDMFALRFGYVSNQDDYGLTMGFGLQTFGIKISYSYTPFDVFDDVNRFTLGFSR